MAENPKTPQSEEATFALSQIISQMEDLVKLAIEGESKPVKEGAPLVDVMNRVLELQKEIQQFHDKSMEFAKELGLTKDSQETNEEALKKLTAEEKRLLSRMDILVKTCEIERQKLYQMIRRGNHTLQQACEEVDVAKAPKHRRKGKFKSLGGKDNWLPT